MTTLKQTKGNFSNYFGLFGFLSCNHVTTLLYECVPVGPGPTFRIVHDCCFSYQELRKPSYAEICQRVKDAPTLQQPPAAKEAKPACAAPTGEERKYSDMSLPTGEAKAHPPSSKPSSATSGRPLRDVRRSGGRWASPPPHPGKTPNKDLQNTPPKSPQ